MTTPAASQVHPPATPSSTGLTPAIAAVFSPRHPLHGVSGSPAGGLPHGSSPLNKTTPFTNIGHAVFDSPNAMAAAAATMGIPMNIGLSNRLEGSRESEEEDQRRLKLQTITALLGKRTSRVSRHSIEQAAKSMNLDCLSETESLSLAGRLILIEIDFAGNDITGVSCTFPSTSGPTSEFASHAAAQLYDDLTTRAGPSRINTSITPFLENLTRLATLDKLSTPPYFDCLEATAGLYASLKKIYEHEKGKLVSGKPNVTSEVIEYEMVCEKSGRPAMHSGRSVGASIEYWVERSKLAPDSGNGETERVWRILLECEACDATMYTPARTSNDWISSHVEKSEEDLFGTVQVELDWQDPPVTMLPAAGIQPNPDKDAMELDSTSLQTSEELTRLPDVRFVARFDPPLAVPLTVAMNLIASTGAHLNMESLETIALDNYILPLDASANPAQVFINTPRVISLERTITPSAVNDSTETRRQAHTINWPQRETGYLLQIPFFHPKQIIAILPTLRQYARFNSIVRSSFSKQLSSSVEASGELTEDTNAAATVPTKVNVDVLTSPIPRLEIDFSITEDSGGSVAIDFIENGQILLEDFVAGAVSTEKATKVFEACEDVGTFLEVMRQWQ